MSDDIFRQSLTERSKEIAQQEATAALAYENSPDARAARLVREFARRMGGTERTKILTGPAPTRTVKVRSGLFRSHEREDPDDERQPYVMGWAFVTAAGDGWEPTYSTYTPTDEYGRRGATAAEIMAVDVTGQLWFVKTGEMPKRIGLVDVATVVAYGLYTEKWNGKALPLLCRCTYVHSPYLDRPPHSNAPQVVQDEYKAKLAAWDAKVAKVDKILALGLGAALEDAGR